MRHICLDIYRLTFKGYDREESESRFEFLKSASEVWIDPIELFQQELPNAKSSDFAFVILWFGYIEIIQSLLIDITKK